MASVATDLDSRPNSTFWKWFQKITNWLWAVILVGFAISVVRMNIVDKTVLLTSEVLFPNTSLKLWFFLTALILGVGAAFQLHKTVGKRILYSLVFFGFCIACLVINLSLAEDVAEQSRFSNGKSELTKKMFFIEGVRSGSKGNRNAYVSNAFYEEIESVSINQTAYQFLTEHVGEYPKRASEGQVSSSTNSYCLKVDVEQNGDAARILIPRKFSSSDIIACPESVKKS
jgi:dolichyl-phosphate-mannose--protein O-mannosyl transferase